MRKLETTEELKEDKKHNLFKDGRIYVNGKVIKEGIEELREECEAFEAFVESIGGCSVFCVIV